MQILRPFLIALGLFGALSSLANAEIAVVASIKPIHSLVAAIMEGVGQPGLIVKALGSEHVYSLKPSQAAELEKADLVFWIGPQMETYLAKPLETLASGATIVALANTEGLVKLPLREGGAFEAHEDEDHEPVGKAHDAAKSGTEENHGEFDAHVWLDPQNAKILAGAISRALAQTDPANAAKYDEKAQALNARLDALTAELESMLAPVKGKGFIVFHDAYHYFENRFGISASGSITVSPEVAPGAERMAEIRAKVLELGATCVFSEPQFTPQLISVVVDGTQADTGVLDPLGSALHDGPGLYFDLMRNLAKSLRDCLADTN